MTRKGPVRLFKSSTGSVRARTGHKTASTARIGLRAQASTTPYDCQHGMPCDYPRVLCYSAHTWPVNFPLASFDRGIRLANVTVADPEGFGGFARTLYLSPNYFIFTGKVDQIEPH